MYSRERKDKNEAVSRKEVKHVINIPQDLKHGVKCVRVANVAEGEKSPYHYSTDHLGKSRRRQTRRDL